MGQNLLGRNLREIYRRAGINKKRSRYLLRRTFATHLLKSGTGIETVSKFLGHSKIQTTIDSYANVVDRMDRAVERLKFGKSAD